LKATNKVQMFRAGLWKPRTRPDAFEGVGAEGLAWLKEARSETGLPIATEIAKAAHVEACLEAGLDALWIGARTTVSPFAVQEIADALAGTNIPVIVKNPMHADLKLWIGAIERVTKRTHGSVIALHRGFSSYGLQDFRNAPMWEIPISFRAEMPKMPLLCDPSHIAGDPELLLGVAQKAMDLGMLGLMIESHPRPREAWSDAKQQITAEGLSRLLEELIVRDADELPAGDELRSMRLQMDSLDQQLIELLGNRMDLARSIGDFKQNHGLTVLQLERWREVFATRSDWGENAELGFAFVTKLLEQIHKESIRVQTEVMNRQKL
jgi:chorismate mutase